MTFNEKMKLVENFNMDEVTEVSEWICETMEYLPHAAFTEYVTITEKYINSIFELMGKPAKNRSMSVIVSDFNWVVLHMAELNDEFGLDFLALCAVFCNDLYALREQYDIWKFGGKFVVQP